MEYHTQWFAAQGHCEVVHEEIKQAKQMHATMEANKGCESGSLKACSKAWR